MKRHLGYVPIQLIEYSLRNNKQNSLRVYLALKYLSSDGILPMGLESKRLLSDTLEVSRKTIENQLKKIEKEGWISNDGRMIFIRGYNRLDLHQSWICNSRAELHSDFLKKENFNAYLLGAVIGYYIKIKRSKKYFEGQKKACSTPSKYIPLPFSLRYLNSITCKNHHFLIENLNRAIDLGLLKRFSELKRTNIPCSQLKPLRAAWIEGEPYPKCLEGKVVFQHPDKYLCNIHFKRIRKKKHQINKAGIIRDNRNQDPTSIKRKAS